MYCPFYDNVLYVNVLAFATSLVIDIALAGLVYILV